MVTIVYRSEFIFNEMKHFSDLLDRNNVAPENKEKVIQQLNLKDIDYKFVYEKDAQGGWYRHCYKGNECLQWSDIAYWMRPYVWEYENRNRMFQL